MKGKKSGKVTLNVTQADYDAGLAKGIEPEALLKPGRHTGVRGGFLARHNVTPEQVRNAPVKVRITIMLDHDVLEHFKARAAQPGTAPYQTLINQTLRDSLAGRREQAGQPVDELAERIAEKVAARLKPKRKRAA